MAFQTEVTLGYTNAQHAEILNGIEIGDEIVTEGNTNLRNKTLIYTPEMKEEAQEAQEAQDASSSGNAAITSGSNKPDEGQQA